MIDGSPKLLEFRSVESFVEGILRWLCLIGVGKHLLENTVIKDSLHQLVHTFFQWFETVGQRNQCTSSNIIPIFLSYKIIRINVVVLQQILVNLLRLTDIKA